MEGGDFRKHIRQIDCIRAVIRYGYRNIDWMDTESINSHLPFLVTMKRKNATTRSTLPPKVSTVCHWLVLGVPLPHFCSTDTFVCGSFAFLQRLDFEAFQQKLQWPINSILFVPNNARPGRTASRRPASCGPASSSCTGSLGELCRSWQCMNETLYWV